MALPAGVSEKTSAVEHLGNPNAGAEESSEHGGLGTLLSRCDFPRFILTHFRPYSWWTSVRRFTLNPRMFDPANKTPEPTTFTVTSRAIVRLIEMKQQNPDRDAARAAPAKVVAHL